ncbi:hypothetical protein ABW11_06145 [Pluralibacter gergoviae]|uniref:hypothetical protein n=1 Tax=Pluralibacter gergoviae TaxID=61647 RepID=UPI0006512088|nr:hypothetical protein [Pluralibacter gergoviae]KMK28944.1 hypothetical protein ABW11_06145 [Pluralibacter gergoviae]
MAITSVELREHIKESVSAEHLSNIAYDAGFKNDRYFDESHYLENAIYAFNSANLLNLSEIDDFIEKNIEKIEVFFQTLTKGNKNFWFSCQPFYFELVTILKEPDIFTVQYQKHNKWDEDVVDIVDAALKTLARS